MALAAVIRVRLENADFTESYEQNAATWKQIAKEALDYVKKRNSDPRPDDIAPHIALALPEHPVFRQVMSDKRQRAQRWYRDFADLIVDRIWNDFLQGGLVTWPR